MQALSAAGTWFSKDVSRAQPDPGGRNTWAIKPFTDLLWILLPHRQTGSKNMPSASIPLWALKGLETPAKEKDTEYDTWFC